MHRLLILIAAMVLASCAGNERDIAVAPLTPVPVKTDPTDEQLKESVRGFLKNTEAPVASQYQFSRIDLDADGRRDALVLFKNPYGYWCGMHGCTMLVLKANNTDFDLVNAIQPVREPLYIAQDETNGWRNMFVRVSGRWSDAKDVKITYNGHKYPDNPSNLPEDPTFSFSEAIPVFRQ